MKYLFYIALTVNFLSFAAYCIDKRKAVKDKRRISEKALLTWAFFAPFGALAAMYTVRHKTKKAKFYIAVPFFCLLQTAAIIYYIYTTII